MGIELEKGRNSSRSVNFKETNIKTVLCHVFTHIKEKRVFNCWGVAKVAWHCVKSLTNSHLSQSPCP